VDAVDCRAREIDDGLVRDVREQEGDFGRGCLERSAWGRAGSHWNGAVELFRYGCKLLIAVDCAG